MDLEEIRQIVELMDKHELSLFHLEREGINLKLKKGVDADEALAALQARAQSVPVAVPAPASTAAAAPNESAAPAAEVAVDNPNEKEISSPMVGTFYRSPSPDSSPYVSVGDEVDEETVICIIEAMKVMNEVKAETKGVITKVLGEDGTPVQYGQPLFLVNPA